MLKWVYAASLLFSIGGLMLLDWRHKLALFHDKSRALLTIAVAVAIFAIWDIFGIALGIFFSGDSAYASSLQLLPEFPPEEILFLILLCYITLLIYQGVERGYCHLSRFKR